jgi:hypothetical protein
MKNDNLAALGEFGLISRIASMARTRTGDV